MAYEKFASAYDKGMQPHHNMPLLAFHGPLTAPPHPTPPHPTPPHPTPPHPTPPHPTPPHPTPPHPHPHPHSRPCKGVAKAYEKLASAYDKAVQPHHSMPLLDFRGPLTAPPPLSTPPPTPTQGRARE
jgi:hypothetical protein